MVYAVTNPPSELLRAPFNRGGVPSLWSYKTADASAVFSATDYFSNGDKLGMKVGDFVLIYDSNTPKCHINVVITVTAGGAASLNADGNNLDLTMS